MTKHIPLGILAIVAIVGVATLMLSVNLVEEPSPLAISYIPGTYAQPPQADSIIIRLDIGQFLGDEINAVTQSQLAGLQSGTVNGKDLRTDYIQIISFKDPGVFNGGHIIFGKDEHGTVSDFLQFDDSVFKYTIDFSPGLRSKIDGGKLPDIEDEDMRLMGDTYSIVDTAVNTGSKRVSIKLFGGYGSIEFEDNSYADDNYYEGVMVNGQHIDARVKIKAVESSGKLTIYTIQYLLNANAVVGGQVQVLPLHCTREFLQYPTGLLSPNFDICYKGLGAAAVAIPSGGISGNEAAVKPRGNDEYIFRAANLMGQVYDIPLAQLPGMYGNKGRNFLFVEAGGPGAPNINVGDYFIVTSSNDIQGVSHILRYNQIDSTNNQVYFQDLTSGSQKTASFDPGSMEGDFLMSEGTYHFKIGAGNALAMDQDNDGSISGSEAKWVFPGGSMIDFGPGFVVKIITPKRLFDEPPATNEMTSFNIVFGGDINLVVPSPQATVPGYSFELQSQGGGVRSGLTKYGILFTWTQDHSADLKLVIPGAYARSVKGGAGAEVYVTLERQKLVKQPQVPAPPPKCGDKLITKPEYCDPPGSACADEFKRSGKCSDDCLNCIYTPKAMCGNGLLEKGEQCENSADCPVGFGCNSCACVQLPQSVCGNNLIEPGEQCEKNVDCAAGFMCAGCYCVTAPAQQVPAPVPEKNLNIFARFFAWLAHLFGA